jgi:hypothetical protein
LEQLCFYFQFEAVHFSLLEEQSEQPQIENKSKAVPMPDEFKSLYKKFLELKKLNKQL